MPVYERREDYDTHKGEPRERYRRHDPGSIDSRGYPDETGQRRERTSRYYDSPYEYERPRRQRDDGYGSPSERYVVRVDDDLGHRRNRSPRREYGSSRYYDSPYQYERSRRRQDDDRGYQSESNVLRAEKEPTRRRDHGREDDYDDYDYERVDRHSDRVISGGFERERRDYKAKDDEEKRLMTERGLVIRKDPQRERDDAKLRLDMLRSERRHQASTQSANERDPSFVDTSPPTKSSYLLEEYRDTALEQPFSTLQVKNSTIVGGAHPSTPAHQSNVWSRPAPMTPQKPATPFAALPTTNDIENIRALLEPAKYFQELDDLESQVIGNSLLSDIFRGPSGTMTEIQKSFRDNTCLDWAVDNATELSNDHIMQQCLNILQRVLATVETLRADGFMKDWIAVLVENHWRPGVVRTVEIGMADIMSLRNLLGYDKTVQSLESGTVPDGVRTLVRDNLNRLGAFGVSIGIDYKSFVRGPLASLCALWSLAVVSYTGSHTTNLGQRIWATEVTSINFVDLGMGPTQLSFKQRRLACLDSFIGGPVWVFCSTANTQHAWLSTSIESLADLWGPLYAVPDKRIGENSLGTGRAGTSATTESSEQLIAIHTEGGILFQQPRHAEAPALKNETLTHWLSAAPLRRHGTSSGNLQTYARNSEKLPSNLLPFPATRRLLIGQPTSGATSLTVTSTPANSLSYRTGTATYTGFYLNDKCKFNMNEFGQMHSFHLHPIGTREAYYEPNEYQVSFMGGQYVNVGLQRAWKKRPAVTHKMSLLEYVSKPCAPPERVCQILKLRVGLEMSACTLNAQRVVLEDALKLAFPSQRLEVDAACDSGDPQAVSKFLCQLEATGVSHDKSIQLYWPLSTGIGQTLELPNQPQWAELLRDSRITACFAVVTNRCFPYSGQRGRRSVQRVCSRLSGSTTNAVLQTAIELDPQAMIKPPLKADERLNLDQGRLKIRSEVSQGQLASYESHGSLRKWQRGSNITHRELLDVSYPSPYQVSLCIVDE